MREAISKHAQMFIMGNKASLRVTKQRENIIGS